MDFETIRLEKSDGVAVLTLNRPERHNAIDYRMWDELPQAWADIDSDAYRDSLSEPCRRQFDEFDDSTLHVSSEEYVAALTAAQQKGVLIFTVDYAVRPDNVAWTYETSRALGFVPFVSNRALNQFVEPNGVAP